MPGADGVHKVVSKDIEQDGAEEEAIEAAREYCEKRELEAVFIEEKTAYKGSMDENTRKTVRKASTAAMVVGGVGSVLGSAGSAGHMMTNDRDYESQVRFKCQ